MIDVRKTEPEALTICKSNYVEVALAELTVLRAPPDLIIGKVVLRHVLDQQEVIYN